MRRVNCHHNFTQHEDHNGESLWITRKGAIKAAVGDMGVILGSMGTRSYLVDEIPAADKDIDQVMADQDDLVEVRHTLRQVLNYKGT
jgi:tRNA-splicing ligase RtcB